MSSLGVNNILNLHVLWCGYSVENIIIKRLILFETSHTQLPAFALFLLLLRFFYWWTVFFLSFKWMLRAVRGKFSAYRPEYIKERHGVWEEAEGKGAWCNHRKSFALMDWPAPVYVTHVERWPSRLSPRIISLANIDLGGVVCGWTFGRGRDNTCFVSSCVSVIFCTFLNVHERLCL